MIRNTLCLKAFLALGLLRLSFDGPNRAAAQATVVAGPQTGVAMQLRIVILDGENALNNIRQRTAREPVIQIEDENHKPVAGVAIVFLIHGGNTGAGGSFAGAQSLSTVTDSSGRAVGKGFTSNSISGNFTIEVTATAGMGAAAVSAVSAIIHQSNIFGGAEISQGSSSTARHASIFTKHFWVVTGTAVAVGGTIAVVTVLTNSNGATITAGAGGVTHP